MRRVVNLAPGTENRDGCIPAWSKCWRDRAFPAPRAGRRSTAAHARRTSGAACAGARRPARPSFSAQLFHAGLNRARRKRRPAAVDEQRVGSRSSTSAARCCSHARSAASAGRADRHHTGLAALAGHAHRAVAEIDVAEVRGPSAPTDAARTNKRARISPCRASAASSTCHAISAPRLRRATSACGSDFFGLGRAQSGAGIAW